MTCRVRVPSARPSSARLPRQPASAAARIERNDGYVENSTRDLNEGNLAKTAASAKLKYEGSSGVDATLGLTWSTTTDDGGGLQLSAATDASLALYRLFNPDAEAEIDNHTTSDAPSFDDRDVLSAFFELNVPIGAHTLTAITGVSRFTSQTLLDVDFSPAPLMKQNFDDDYWQATQEIRIASPLQTFEYVAGLYFFASRLDGLTDLDILEGIDAIELVEDALLSDTLATLLAPLLGGLPPLTLPLDEGSLKTFDQDTISGAIFGQATWHITEALGLTVGLRASWERKTIETENILQGTGLLLNGIAGQEDFIVSDERTEFAVSPKIAIKYQVSDAIMSYGTIAHGYKGGGFNEQAGTPDELDFDEENSLTYEAGLKTEWMGGLLRANLAAYYTQFSNLQVSVYNGINFVVGNAAEATTKGIEAELRLILPPYLVVSGALGYTHARYDTFENAPCPAGTDPPCDLSGRELTRAPAWNGSLTLQGAVPLFKTGIELVAGSDLLFQTKSYLSTDLDEADSQAAYMQINLRAGLRDDEGLWSLIVFLRNLTDEQFSYHGADVPLLQGNHFGAFDPGRRYSAEFRIAF